MRNHITDEPPITLGKLTNYREWGLMMWRDGFGRWEICLGNWSDLWDDSVLKFRDLAIDLNAPYKTGDCDDLTKFLISNGKLWATVADDEGDRLPELLDAHVAVTVYNYGDLMIVCPVL
ncbi:MAG: hypothetical protein GX246_00190 [Clostridiales bacterium]|nr:hypothetical protein [Bacillota bacterium]NLL53554.1 hypothetical protein [Clostridiales bacterium]